MLLIFTSKQKYCFNYCMLIISAYIYVEVFEKVASPSVRGRGVLGCKHRLGKHVVISLCDKKGKEALLLQSCADKLGTLVEVDSQESQPRREQRGV